MNTLNLAPPVLRHSARPLSCSVRVSMAQAQSLRVLKSLLLAAEVSLVLAFGTFSSVAHAATITIDAPVTGTTPLTCVVTCSVPIGLDATEHQEYTGSLRITDNTGDTSSSITFPSPGGWTGIWDTTRVANGVVSLQAVMRYYSKSATGATESHTIFSKIVTVTVQNGFYQNTDAAKTYAKVTQPTNGQSIIANGQNFVITSDHQITWTRYDNCGDYHQSYEFRRTCSYPNAFDVVVNGSYTLPKKIGDVQVQQTLGASPYIAGGGTPATYVVYAFCYTPDMNTQVASGNSNFTMTAPPH